MALVHELVPLKLSVTPWVSFIDDESPKPNFEVAFLFFEESPNDHESASSADIPFVESLRSVVPAVPKSNWKLPEWLQLFPHPPIPSMPADPLSKLISIFGLFSSSMLSNVDGKDESGSEVKVFAGSA